MSKGAMRLAIIAAAVLVVAIAGAIVFGGPFVNYWKGRTGKAEAVAERNADEAAAGSLTVEGERKVAGAAADTATAVAKERSNAHAIERRTRADPTSATRIPPSELDRLREHDDSLCAGVRLACGPTAAAPGR